MIDPQQTLAQFHKHIQNGVTPQSIRRFVSIIKNHYHKHGREFAWRSDTTPYSILVSEIMLQQTQTTRVLPKYEEWMQTFPDFETLANAPLTKVLKVWQGMGYNRRAIALQKCAQIVVHDYGGTLPEDPAVLVQFPHIGPNTAGSIVAFAYNKPTIFIETNIRSVFIAFFFPDHKEVTDKQILELAEKTLDKKNPREWYYALMDYGVLIKKTLPNPNKKSRHYTKQSTFKGSNRELRGAILRALHDTPSLSATKCASLLKKQNISQATKDSVQKNLDTLTKEGFVMREGNTYSLKK